MTYSEGTAALRLIYEMQTGWRVSEDNLAEDRRYTRLKEVTQ